jgi:hypothetical protein
MVAAMCLVRSGQVLDIFGRLEWKALVDTLEIVCVREPMITHGLWANQLEDEKPLAELRKSMRKSRFGVPQNLL